MTLKIRNHLLLAVQSVLFFFPAVFIAIAIHEIGHGIGALLAGAYFNGLHITFFSGTAYTSGVETARMQLYTLAAGSVVASLVGIIVCFGIMPKLKRWDFIIFWYYLGLFLLIDLPRNMFYSAIGGGDFSRVSYLLGIPSIITMVVGALGILFVIYIYAHAIGSLLAKYFSLDTYWQRLSTFLIYIALPMFLTAVGAATLFPHRHLSMVEFFFVIFILGSAMSAMMALFRIKSVHPLIPIPKAPSVVGLGIFSLALLVWLSIFGTPKHPKGIVWSAPRDEEVVGWNLILTVRSDLAVRADFIMRPSKLEFVWEKQRLAIPNWIPYKVLVYSNLPGLMSGSDWSPMEQVHDDTVLYFFQGGEEKGARRISFCTHSLKYSEQQAMKKCNLTLNLEQLLLRECFYRLEICIDTTFLKRTYELIPENSPKPILDTPNTLVFTNDALMKVKTMRVEITRK